MHVGRAPAAGWGELRSPRPSGKSSSGEGHGEGHDDNNNQIDETVLCRTEIFEADPRYPRTADQVIDRVWLIGLVGFVGFFVFIFITDSFDFAGEFHGDSSCRHRYWERGAHGRREETS